MSEQQKLFGWSVPDKPLPPASPQQETIWSFLESDNRHGMVEARAGTGKTFTIVQGCTRLPRTVSVLLLAFNRHIAEELRYQLNLCGVFHVKSLTYHQLGLSMLGSRNPHMQVDKHKLYAILREHFPALFIENDLPKLVKLIKGYGLRGDETEAILELCYRHKIILADRNMVLGQLPALMKKCLSTISRFVDFEDMCWAPSIMHLTPGEQYDLVMVDEYQDTNPVQQYLATSSLEPRHGRLIIVGDRHQALYGFRGADMNAIPAAVEKLTNTKLGLATFPLTVSWRCPRTHVNDLAHQIVPDIEHAEKAPEGIIRVSVSPMDAQKGDLIICRNNAPLFRVWFRLVAKGIVCKIRGNDLYSSLLSLAKKAGLPEDLHDANTMLEDYYQAECYMETNQEYLAFVRDQIDCLKVLIEGCFSMTAIRQKLKAHLEDEDEARREDVVTLGTVHRTKGLEAHRVWIVAPHLLPSPYASQPWELVQEGNLAYVACTRAKYSSVVPDSVPGELNFCGELPHIYRHAWGYR